MARMVDEMRPRNVLDAVGVLFKLAAAILITWQLVLLVRAVQLGTDGWPLSQLLGIAGVALAIIGYSLQRIARKEPLFGRR